VNPEELKKLLKENLEIRVEIDDVGWGSNEVNLRVKCLIYFGDELISANDDSLHFYLGDQ